MTKGLFLGVGLDAVDPKHYAGWSGELNACEADALAMKALLTKQGFTGTTLLTAAATRDRVLQGLTLAAHELKAGDMFVLTNSSHGGQLPDLNGDEADGSDETIAMYDGEITDDELYAAWAAFAPGVRVLMLSDSCHSGTVTKMVGSQDEYRSPSSPRPKHMPADVCRATYYQNQAMYDPILTSRLLAAARTGVKASVQLISGCQDNQTSYDGTFNGLFTGTLLRVWNGGLFNGGYTAFRKRISATMPPEQSPNLYRVGAQDSAYWAQTPFTL